MDLALLLYVIAAVIATISALVGDGHAYAIRLLPAAVAFIAAGLAVQVA